MKGSQSDFIPVVFCLGGYTCQFVLTCLQIALYIGSMSSIDSYKYMQAPNNLNEPVCISG